MSSVSSGSSAPSVSSQKCTTTHRNGQLCLLRGGQMCCLLARNVLQLGTGKSSDGVAA